MTLKAFVLLAPLAACGGSVTDSASGVSAPSPAAPTTHPPDAPHVPVATPTSLLGEPICTGIDTALVVATDGTQVLTAFDVEGKWGAVVPVGKSAARVAAFSDAEGGLGAFVVDANGTATTWTTVDGRDFSMTSTCSNAPGQAPASCFAPLPEASVFAASAAGLVGRAPGAAATPGVAWYFGRFDPDGKVWTASDVFTVDDATEIAAVQSSAGDDLISWRGPDAQLYDRWRRAGVWGPVHRHDLERIPRDAEIPLTSVALAAESNGDVTAIARNTDGAEVGLAATTFHEGAWSTPARHGGYAFGSAPLHFAATAASGDGVWVVGIARDRTLMLQRYARTTGWDPPRSIADSDLGEESPLAVTRGICGEDAMIAYASSSGEVRMVRVRGDAISVPRVVAKLNGPARDVALVTRHEVPR